MQHILGRPLEEALKSLPQGAEPPRVVITVPPGKKEGKAGTLRIVAVRGEEWIAAHFLDAAPREKEEV